MAHVAMSGLLAGNGMGDFKLRNRTAKKNVAGTGGGVKRLTTELVHPSSSVAFPIQKIVLLVAVFLFCRASAVEGGVEAIYGEPFGVGRITVAADELESGITAESHGFELLDEDGRVFYPAYSTTRRAREIVNLFLRGGEDFVPQLVTVWFLFTGDEPLNVTLATPEARTFHVVPQRREPSVHSDFLQNWWREYVSSAKRQMKSGDYPPIVETYLTMMLARRLGFPPPEFGTEKAEPYRTVDLLAGAEGLRTSALRNAMLRADTLQDEADLPLPPEVDWSRLEAPGVSEKVEIESMARRVPPECLYIRFGRFSNFLWMHHLMDDYGGDLSNLVRRRGHNVGMRQKLENQLAIRYSALADLFGDQVAGDMALIGRDLFFREGAAFGVILKVKNSFLLKASLSKERADAKRRNEGCEASTVEIAGRNVSFLSTADNRVRSFYVVDDDYCFISNSRALVERYFEVVDSDGSALADLPAFQHARELMPVKREDTIFAYFSTPFLQSLVSPHYLIELHRRMRSVTDIKMLQVARLAAQAEGRPAGTIDDLIAGGYLPPGFGRRPDGSGPILSDVEIIDSRRGARGTFLPIPDVEVDGITAREASVLARQLEFFDQSWKQMDPIIAGIKRYALNREGLERIVVDANVSPLGEEKYGWLLSMLGPPTDQVIATPENDIVNVQGWLGGGFLGRVLPRHHLYLGVQDVPPAETDRGSLFSVLRLLRETPGYLGAFPKPGLLDLLPLGSAGQPDAAGFSQLPLGVWRRQWNGHSTLSFDPQLLEDVTPQLRLESAKAPAQLRLEMGDLSTSNLSDWLSRKTYDRAHATSLGNARFLHALSQQLHVPRSEAKREAERLLDAQLVCALDGQYKLVRDETGLQRWESTAWKETSPAEYVAPMFGWFRGLKLDLAKINDRLDVHTELDMQRKEKAAGVELPLFDLFK